jgi:hypothetical protein
LTGKKGDYLSVIPLTDKIKLDFDGLVYPPPEKALKFGESLTLRNEFKKKKCHLTIRGERRLLRSSRKSRGRGGPAIKADFAYYRFWSRNDKSRTVKNEI